MSEVKVDIGVELARDEVAFTATHEGSNLYLPRQGEEGISHLTGDQMVVVACFMRASKDEDFYNEMIDWIEDKWLDFYGKPIEKVMSQ